MAAMRVAGSPAATLVSASLPAAMTPRTWPRPQTSANVSVAARGASAGGILGRTRGVELQS